MLYGNYVGSDGWKTVVNATDTSNPGIIRLTGLVPNGSYEVEIYGNVSGTGTSSAYKTTYKIGSQTLDLDPWENTDTVTFSQVSPDVDGNLDVKVYAQPGSDPSRYGVINTLKITRLPDSILFQDFEGSTDVGSYVHATDPGKTKFNDIGSTGTAATVTWSIDNGTLKLVRGGSAITGAGFTRYAGDPADEPDVLLASFDLKVSDLVLNSNSSLGTLEIGDFTSAGAYYNPSSNASTTNRLEVRSVYTGTTDPAATKWRFALTGTSGLVSLPGPTGSTFEQSDTVTVYWVLNARDTAIEYTLNDSTSHSLGAKSSNLHVARNNGSMELLTSTGIPFNDAVWTSTKLSGLRFYSKSANAITLRFDNFDVGPFTIEE